MSKLNKNQSRNVTKGALVGLKVGYSSLFTMAFPISSCVSLVGDIRKAPPLAGLNRKPNHLWPLPTLLWSILLSQCWNTKDAPVVSGISIFLISFALACHFILQPSIGDAVQIYLDTTCLHFARFWSSLISTWTSVCTLICAMVGSWIRYSYRGMCIAPSIGIHTFCVYTCKYIHACIRTYVRTYIT